MRNVCSTFCFSVSSGKNETIRPLPPSYEVSLKKAYYFHLIKPVIDFIKEKRLLCLFLPVPRKCCVITKQYGTSAFRRTLQILKRCDIVEPFDEHQHHQLHFTSVAALEGDLPGL